jgi:hypothetical protein
MQINDSDRFSKSEQVMVQELDGEAVLLDLKSERYFGLDKMGLRMFQVVTSSASVMDACNSLLDEFDVDPSRLRQDLADFLSGLLDAGLLVKNSGSPEKTAKSDRK